MYYYSAIVMIFTYFSSFLFPLLFAVVTLNIQGFFSTIHNAGFFVNYPLTSLTNMLQSKPILHLSVQEYLWGYEDPLIRLASGILPNYIDFGKFGLLDRVSVVLFKQRASDIGELNEVARDIYRVTSIRNSIPRKD